MWDYTDAVKEHFIHPKNVGEIENPDGVGNVGSISCGDALRLTIKVDRATEVITDAKFKTFGCASAIASSSMLTEMIIGMKLEDAEKLSNDDIARALGGLPKEKMHCSVMGREALEAAIADYRGVTLPMAQGQIVCECFGVTDLEIIRAIRENDLKSIEDITHFTKAGGGCGRCHERLQEILDRELHSEAAKTAPPRSRRRPWSAPSRTRSCSPVAARKAIPRPSFRPCSASPAKTTSSPPGSSTPRSRICARTSKT